MRWTGICWAARSSRKLWTSPTLVIGACWALATLDHPRSRMQGTSHCIPVSEVLVYLARSRISLRLSTMSVLLSALSEKTLCGLRAMIFGRSVTLLGLHRRFSCLRFPEARSGLHELGRNQILFGGLTPLTMPESVRPDLCPLTTRMLHGERIREPAQAVFQTTRGHLLNFHVSYDRHQQSISNSAKSPLLDSREVRSGNVLRPVLVK